MKRLLLILFFVVVPSLVKSEIYSIKKYNIDIHVYKDGVIRVREALNIHFNIPRHGIIRKIPLNYVSIKGIRGSIKIYDVNVEGDGYRAYKKQGYFFIKIGKEGVFVNGDKSYVIEYKVFGGINQFGDFDSIAYNLIGNEWDAVIEEAEFFIFLPQKVSLGEDDAYFYSGKISEKCDFVKVIIQKNTLYGRLENKISPGTNIGIWITIPKGIINQSPLKNFEIFFKENRIYFLPISLFIILFILWWFLGKDEIVSKIVHYRLPKDLNPAVAGYVFDDKPDNRDLVSLFFYWAKEGIISIEEVDDPLALFSSKKDYLFRQLKSLPLDAKPFERIIFNELFPPYVKVIRLSSLKDSFYETMKIAKKSLEEYIISMELYDKKTLGFRKILISLSFILFLFSFFIFLRLDRNFGISLFISSGITFLFGSIMPKKTGYGKRVFEIVHGFKEFLEKVERPKLEKMLSKDPTYFDDILPYAVALGMSDKIVKKFEGLFSEPPKYYHSQRKVFTLNDFFISLDCFLEDITMFFGSSKTSNNNTFLGRNFSSGTRTGDGGTSW